MAVGTMVMRNQGYITLQGPYVTLKLRNTPVKEAMLSLAKLYEFVYMDDCDNALNDTEQLTRGADGVSWMQTLNKNPRPVTTSLIQSSGETTTVGGGGGGGAAGTTVGNVSTETATRTTIATFSSNKGPLLGLSGTVDDRLGAITLVGTRRPWSWLRAISSRSICVSNR